MMTTLEKKIDDRIDDIVLEVSIRKYDKKREREDRGSTLSLFYFEKLK
jgi:hypothetical protein